MKANQHPATQQTQAAGQGALHANRPTRKWIIYASVILLLVAVIALLLMLRLRGHSTAPAQSSGIVAGELFPGAGEASSGHLPGMSEQQVKEQMQRVADESKLSFKINARPVFEDGHSQGTLRIENPAHNVYPLVVELFLTATGEKVYDSGGILPDHHISTGALTTALPKGSHEAQAVIHAYDPDTGEQQGRSLVNLTIVVNN